MKHLLPLSLIALLLAGCADDNATNPWSTSEERAASKAEKAAAKHEAEVAKKDTAPAAKLKPVEELPYSFIKKKDEPKPEAAPKAIEANHALITAVRADAGLIQFKRPEPSNPGDKFVLTKDGGSLLVVVSVVDGDSVIADIVPKQVKVPALLVGDEVSCTAPVVEEKPAAK